MAVTKSSTHFAYLFVNDVFDVSETISCTGGMCMYAALCHRLTYICVRMYRSYYNCTQMVYYQNIHHKATDRSLPSSVDLFFAHFYFPASGQAVVTGCRPFFPPVLGFNLYRVWGSAVPLLVDFLCSASDSH